MIARIFLALSLCIAVVGAADEHKKASQDKDPKAAPSKQPAKLEITEPKDAADMPESAREAYKAMDAARAATLDPTKNYAAAGQTPAGEASDKCIAAIKACIVDYLKPVERRVKPRAQLGDKLPDGEAAFLRYIDGYPWTGLGADPNAPIQCALGYATWKHIEWLQDLCEGGVKRYATKKKR